MQRKPSDRRPGAEQPFLSGCHMPGVGTLGRGPGSRPGCSHSRRGLLHRRCGQGHRPRGGACGRQSECQGRSKCPAHRCGDPRVVSALAQAPARCPGLEPSPTMCQPAAAVSGSLLPVPRGQLRIPSPRSASVGGLQRRCFLAGRGSARHTTLV